MRIFIVDDEPLARSRLKRLLTELPEHQCIGEADNANDALNLIRKTKPEVVLLDIAMPEVDGVTLGEQLSQLPCPPALIFITAHPQHALAAYRAHPVDYLLKPVGLSKLTLALIKASSLNMAQIEKQNKLNLITYQKGQQLCTMEVADVLYFASDQKYTRMVFESGSALIDSSLTQLEKDFPGKLLRIHRSKLINIDKLESLYTSENGTHYVKLLGLSHKLEVSRRAFSQVKIAMQKT